MLNSYSDTLAPKCRDTRPVLAGMIDRIEGIEYLRAVMSVFVVAWHLKIAGSSVTYPKAEYSEHTLTVSDFVNFHVLLLAVPTFLFVSTYLYVHKGASATSLRKRLKRLSILLTFWPVAWILYKRGYPGLLEIIPHSPSSFLITLMQAGGTIYYFFVCLMVCLLITHVVVRRTVHVQVGGFILSTAFLSCLPQLSMASGLYALSEYWSPLNFVPFSFAAVLVAQHREYIHARKRILLGILILLSVLFAKFEWSYSAGEIFFPGEGYSIPPYTRPSVVLAVLAIGIIALEATVKANVIVTFMAKYALALYCLHLFVMEPIRGLVSKVSQNNLALASGSLVVVILLSYALALVMRVYLKEEVIM